ncbi:hypothetical protein Anas_01441 [Armadillidium nasatum]|uniref:Uncharacterized protein n=1 Tax=Armadillidium nasatum TaxID=96803 RepID=A0A5N5STQ9_9CRUS|nr:hypothetical protein Anas_01441 [Armadillidium nasatum]
MYLDHSCLNYGPPSACDPREPECSWHLNASLNDLTKFCSLYDGYKPFCRCHDRAPLLPKFGTDSTQKRGT